MAAIHVRPAARLGLTPGRLLAMHRAALALAEQVGFSLPYPALVCRLEGNELEIALEMDWQDELEGWDRWAGIAAANGLFAEDPDEVAAMKDRII
jgi:hypothetical protein